MPIFKRFAREAQVSVEDVMSSPPVTVSNTSRLVDAAKTMWEKKVGSLIVVAEGKVVGILTERDMIYAAARDLLGRPDFNVGSIMARNVITVHPQDHVRTAVEKMRSFNLRHLVVVDEEGKPLGVLSTRDVLDIALSLLGLLTPTT